MPVAQPLSDAVEDARSMYRRVLTGWALDAARLRRSGLDRPTRRAGAGLGLPRNRVARGRGQRQWTSCHALGILSWSNRPGEVGRLAA